MQANRELSPVKDLFTGTSFQQIQPTNSREYLIQLVQTGSKDSVTLATSLISQNQRLTQVIGDEIKEFQAHLLSNNHTEQWSAKRLQFIQSIIKQMNEVN